MQAVGDVVNIVTLGHSRKVSEKKKSKLEMLYDSTFVLLGILQDEIIMEDIFIFLMNNLPQGNALLSLFIWEDEACCWHV